MALITSSNIIRTHCLFHLSVAYFLITSPSTISNQSLVFVLGQAMGLPTPPSFSVSSGPTALLAAVISLLAFADLTATSLPEEISAYYWASQAPIRCMFFFAVIGYSYALKPGGPIRTTAASTGLEWGNLHNSVIFTWGFVEMVTWFWAYVTLKEERRELAVKLAEKRRAESENT